MEESKGWCVCRGGSEIEGRKGKNRFPRGKRLFFQCPFAIGWGGTVVGDSDRAS